MRGHGRVDRGPASGPDDHWSVAPIIRRRGHRGASGCCLGSFCCRPSLGSGRCRVIGDVRACWCAAVPDPVANVEPDQVSSIRPRRRSTHTADRWRLRRGSHERNAVPRSGGSREPVRCRGDAGVAHHPADSRNRRPGAAAGAARFALGLERFPDHRRLRVGPRRPAAEHRLPAHPVDADHADTGGRAEG